MKYKSDRTVGEPGAAQKKAPQHCEYSIVMGILGRIMMYSDIVHAQHICVQHFVCRLSLVMECWVICPEAWPASISQVRYIIQLELLYILYKFCVKDSFMYRSAT